MPLPTGPRLIGPDCVDYGSPAPPDCLFPGQPIGPSACFTSPNVFINKAPAVFGYQAGVPSAVSGASFNPLTLPICIVPRPRVFGFNRNTHTQINKQLPVTILGSGTILGGVPRGLIGPPSALSASVVIGGYFTGVSTTTTP